MFVIVDAFVVNVHKIIIELYQITPECVLKLNEYLVFSMHSLQTVYEILLLCFFEIFL